jgi:hypothetical protein
MFPALGKILVPDEYLRRLQEALVTAINRINRVEILDNREVEVAVGVTEAVVEHGLGRLPVGWEVVDKDAQGDVWRSRVSTSRFLYLTASAGMNVKIRVY